MKLINTDKAEGTKVAGIYCGQKFTGTVSEVRFAPRGSYHYTIKLHSPISVFGAVREEVGFYSGDSEAQSLLVQ